MDKQTMRQAIEWIETSDACHFNLRNAWNEFKECDPVDALKDAELLYEVLKARLKVEV